MDLYKILEEADSIFIAYDDPCSPRKKVCTHESQIDNNYEKTDNASTPVKTRRAIKKLGLSNDQYTQGRALINQPSIIHKVHRMRRSELEYTISFAIECKKKQTGKRKGKATDRPASRHLITSRFSKRSINAYNNHIYESHTPIT